MTNALRRIRNAWHFYHALILVIKIVCGSSVLRCSPLKRALCSRWITTHHQLFLIAHSYHIMLYIML
ncbi:DUF3265 domain-containing protein [Vibrio cholerae]|nr:DUF3265 domain-containing protein [Vibrio cholerae]ELJ8645924.1 DUF3265 domain-containing protein [Vibrio cholerae]